MEKRKIQDLISWDRNPKRLSQVAYERLKDSLTLLGSFKPLLITNDNLVLGGNQRLVAMRELGIDEADVVLIDFIEEEGIWHAVINGVKQLKTFTSRLQAMTEYALADNSRSGTYNEDLLANLLSEAEINISDLDYTIDLGEPLNLEEILEKEAKVKNFNIVIECLSEEEKKEKTLKLQELGFRAK